MRGAKAYTMTSAKVHTIRTAKRSYAHMHSGVLLLTTDQGESDHLTNDGQFDSQNVSKNSGHNSKILRKNHSIYYSSPHFPWKHQRLHMLASRGSSISFLFWLSASNRFSYQQAVFFFVLAVCCCEIIDDKANHHAAHNINPAFVVLQLPRTGSTYCHPERWCLWFCEWMSSLRSFDTVYECVDDAYESTTVGLDKISTANTGTVLVSGLLSTSYYCRKYAHGTDVRCTDQKLTVWLECLHWNVRLSSLGYTCRGLVRGLFFKE